MNDSRFGCQEPNSYGVNSKYVAFESIMRSPGWRPIEITTGKGYLASLKLVTLMMSEKTAPWPCSGYIWPLSRWYESARPQ